MRIPVSFHTAQKMADLLSFLDCGATECFISQEFIENHKLGTQLLTKPQLLWNADGSPNIGGSITHYTDLEVLTGPEEVHTHQFYIANMGGDHMVLRYPWFAAANPQIDWRQGLLPALVIV